MQKVINCLSACLSAYLSLSACLCIISEKSEKRKTENNVNGCCGYLEGGCELRPVFHCMLSWTLHQAHILPILFEICNLVLHLHVPTEKDDHHKSTIAHFYWQMKLIGKSVHSSVFKNCRSICSLFPSTPTVSLLLCSGSVTMIGFRDANQRRHCSFFKLASSGVRKKADISTGRVEPALWYSTSPAYCTMRPAYSLQPVLRVTGMLGTVLDGTCMGSIYSGGWMSDICEQHTG